MPALVFDYDGLMVDSERVLAEAVVEVIAGRGGRVCVADIAHLFGTTESDAEWERLVPAWCDPPLTAAELYALITPTLRAQVDELSLLPGVEKLITAAKSAGWEVGLATGHARDRLDVALARLGVHQHFDAIVTAADVARGKPAPDIFLDVADRLAVPADECVVLEDSPPGCEAALAAGMFVVACPSIVTRDLTFPAEAHRVDSLSELTIDDLLRRVASPR